MQTRCKRRDGNFQSRSNPCAARDRELPKPFCGQSETAAFENFGYFSGCKEQSGASLWQTPRWCRAASGGHHSTVLRSYRSWSWFQNPESVGAAWWSRTRRQKQVRSTDERCAAPVLLQAVSSVAPRGTTVLLCPQLYVRHQRRVPGSVLARPLLDTHCWSLRNGAAISASRTSPTPRHIPQQDSLGNPQEVPSRASALSWTPPQGMDLHCTSPCYLQSRICFYLYRLQPVG